MKRALIVNAVMVNNGDAGLVLALSGALEKAGFEVTIATFNLAFSSEKYAGRRFCQDVVGSRWLGPFKLLAFLLIPLLVVLSPSYRRADLLVGAPGGYINSYYGFRWKLYVYKWAQALGKRTVLYSQSIGPLNEADRRVLGKYSQYLDLILVRDQLSQDNALDAGVAPEKLLLTDDAIFLRSPVVLRPTTGPTVARSACVSVRDWKFDGRQRDRYYEMILRLVQALLDSGYTVDFLSTCQGIPGYVDDSRTAKAILARMGGDRDGVRVVEGYFTLPQLEEKIRGYDVVIGTRLHMCLFSLQNGVPAFNISYESKGVECYKYLGAEEWTVDYNGEPETAVVKLESFLASLVIARCHFGARIADCHTMACKSLNLVMAALYAEEK